MRMVKVLHPDNAVKHFAFALLLWTTASDAATPQIAQLLHTSWTARDGAPQQIYRMALGVDGTLWIGAAGGLFQFDGLSFKAFQPGSGENRLPANAVESIYVSRDGAAWVGFESAGLARIKGDHVTLYDAVEGKKLGTVQSILQTPDGDIWATVDQKYLIHLRADGAWHAESAPDATQSSRVSASIIDSSGTLWIASGGRLYKRPLNQTLYTQTDVSVDILFSAIEAPDGTIWLADFATSIGGLGRIQQIDKGGHVLTSLVDKEGEPEGIAYASDGSLWIGMGAAGLWKYRVDDEFRRRTGDLSSVIDRYTRLNGLSADMCNVLLIDRDGNLWVGTKRGLDRFRSGVLQPFIPQSDECPGGHRRN
jgi:hypothetical protein